MSGHLFQFWFHAYANAKSSFVVHSADDHSKTDWTQSVQPPRNLFTIRYGKVRIHSLKAIIFAVNSPLNVP